MTTKKREISRVLRDVLEQQQIEKHLLSGAFEVDRFMLASVPDIDKYIAHRKQNMYMRMSEHLRKHSKETLRIIDSLKEPASRHVYQTESWIFTEDELLDLLEAVERAAMHTQIGWGRFGD